jgi:uncharacterized protein
MAGRAGRPIAQATAFWDTSALVPLCVRQSNTPHAMALYKRYQAVVWWATSVEIASALARLVRMQLLAPADWAKARHLASRLADTWSVIQPFDVIRTKATKIIERYDLRAAGALQMAAALEWCQDTPRGRVLLMGDDRLLQAATLVGFSAARV